MNLILLFDDDFIDHTHQHIRLSGRRYRHVRDIFRVSVGDRLSVGLCNGGVGTGEITAFNDAYLEMDVKFDSPAPPPLPVTLVLAFPRPIMLKRVLSTASSMGVKHIILFHSHRVEKSYWNSPALKAENLKEPLVLGLEQARDTILPRVELKPLFKPFVEDDLAGITRNTLAIVAHPQSTDPCPRNVKERVTLVIGPEGGFIPYEIEKLVGLGFLPIHLGERILRVETVVPVVLSKLF